MNLLPAALTIAVTDADGTYRNFRARKASLDCGAGSLEFKAGSPSCCRQFDQAVLSVCAAAGDTSLTLYNGTASLSASALHILCEAFCEEPDCKMARA